MEIQETKKQTNKKHLFIAGDLNHGQTLTGLHTEISIHLFQVASIWPIALQRLLDLSYNLSVARKLFDYVFPVWSILSFVVQYGKQNLKIAEINLGSNNRIPVWDAL